LEQEKDATGRSVAALWMRGRIMEHEHEKAGIVRSCSQPDKFLSLAAWARWLEHAERRRGCSTTPLCVLTHFVANLLASPPGLALQARDDIPRRADVLESES
jgi:hypothetical protein